MKADRKIESLLRDEDDQTRLIERPDGFYWQHESSGALHGPFPTLADALEDAGFAEDAGHDASTALHEAEDEIGISDWINPDTGELAEGSVPHFNE